MNLQSVFGTGRPVVGMVHLAPLPGAPRYGGDRDAIREAALRDARALSEGGVDAILVENFGDAPFYPDSVPAHAVASMTALVADITHSVALPVGVNVLRNDAEAALSVAAATGAEFVRVNVHTGARVADQGLLEGRAHETVRLRERLDADVALLADLDVKHSVPLGGEFSAEEFADTAERGLADGVVVSGSGTGRKTSLEAVERAATEREEYGLDTPVFVGSGVTADSVTDLLSVADGVIVGTSLKEGGETTNPVDPDRVRRVVDAADAIR
ncbi:BtpA/SgcQ family protein [Natronorarus salvus]|uniref:BtpA/SgcQ family protein n=1 Tax=Natronorarus salvus TaxID=3117733 RepID=UPI002F26C61C